MVANVVGVPLGTAPGQSYGERFVPVSFGGTQITGAKTNPFARTSFSRPTHGDAIGRELSYSSDRFWRGAVIRERLLLAQSGPW